MAQHPRFEMFKLAWRAQDYAQALGHIEAVIADNAHVASLHWYRANCLQKLERFPEARAAVAQVLALKPDHAAALVLQVQMDWPDHEYPDEPTPAQLAEQERQTAERRRRHVAQLKRALDIDPTLADACFELSQLLRDDTTDESSRNDQADSLLERAVALAPDRIDFRLARAELHHLRAMQVPDGTPDALCVQTFTGMTYLRAELEAALSEFESCARLDGTHRYYVRMGMTLHDLGRYDEALARYDEALRRLPADSPQRPYIVQTRARSENNGAGERNDMARLLESLIEPGDRSQADDNAATALLGAARAVRGGKRLDAALGARVPESPDDFMAANIAEQILNVAYEAKPELVAADPATFPAFQRKYAARQRKALEGIGLRHVADAEATGMTPTMGQRVLLGLYADATGETNVATFAMRPKWPGLIGFALMFVTGKWKTNSLTECVAHFDDGGYLITQYENVSPFTYGSAVDVERLPRGTSVAALVERHDERMAAYRQAHPSARAYPATDLAAIEANWIRGQAIKREYRRSIGYATDAELRGMLGAHYDRFAAKIKQKLLELAADREADTLDA